MNASGVWECTAFVATVMVLARPLGRYMARVYEGEATWLSPLTRPIERLVYRVCGIDPSESMSWRDYVLALMLFNCLGLLVVWGILVCQGSLPWNPRRLPSMSFDLAFNTATSFATNTNWQAYSGETALSPLSQMLGLGVQNFLSAGTGMAVLVALIRGLRQRESPGIGSFWVDLTRGTVQILLPLSILGAALLIQQGVVQSWSVSREVSWLDTSAPSATAASATESTTAVEREIPLGPAASQIAIKQLGTNGGGYFGVNSAHPLENPTPLSSFLQLVAILLIPAACCVTFGAMVRQPRQGWALLAAMWLIYLPLAGVCIWAEQTGNPRLETCGVDQLASGTQGGGNMEGKEARLGVSGSALWATATTAASNGSVNSMHDSYTPLGGLAPLWLMQLGEVVFGGVGSGLYGMLIFVLVAVFVAGLMVGRTPEYLGKKIEAREMKLAAIVILVPPLLVLGTTAIAVSTSAGKMGVTNPGPHGFSQVLYACSSAGNNNGSAFAGLMANSVFYNLLLAISMFISRYALIVPVLALAGSLAAKKSVPTTAGTLPTHTPLFVVWLAGIVVLVGALTFVPALALGPIVEHLRLVAPVASAG